MVQKTGVKIVIVEDHLIFLEVLRGVCVRDFGYEVAGATTSGREGVELILRTAPDVVLLDLSLPDIDGFNVAEQVFARHPTTRILVLSSHCDDYTLYRVEKSGVSGFVDKNAGTVKTLREALRAIADGRAYFSKTFMEAKAARLADATSFMKVLTERERAILALIGRGFTDEEIAVRLAISPRTASTHRSHIMHKLGIPSTPKLIAFALEHGVTQVQPRRGGTQVFP